MERHGVTYSAGSCQELSAEFARGMRKERNAPPHYYANNAEWQQLRTAPRHYKRAVRIRIARRSLIHTLEEKVRA